MVFGLSASSASAQSRHAGGVRNRESRAPQDFNRFCTSQEMTEVWQSTPNTLRTEWDRGYEEG